jgi:hypothetical protein
LKSVRPSQAEPIPAADTAPRIGTILIRFVGMLVIAVAILALAWNR